MMNSPDAQSVRRTVASMGAMLVMAVCIGLGEKMAERFLPLYLLALGSTAFWVGVLNAMDVLLGAVYSFPGGYVSDRLGYRRALVVFTLIAMGGYAVAIVIPSWQAVLIGSVFFIAWTAVSLPAIMSMVSEVMSVRRRVLGVSLHSFVRRIPMALGPVLGGFLIGAFGIERGVRIAFIAAFVLGVIAIWFVLRFMQDGGRRSEKTPVFSFFKYVRGDLLQLLVSDILVRFAEQIPYAFVVVWAVNTNGISPLQFGVLTTIEMITAMLVYIPVAYLADAYGKKPFIVMTFVFFTLFPLALCVARRMPLLIVAFVIRGLKEFGEPTRKALIMELAPEHAKAGTFGAYYLVRDVIVSGAALSSAWLWTISPYANFLAAAGCGALGTVLFAVWGRDVARTGARPAAAAVCRT